MIYKQSVVDELLDIVDEQDRVVNVLPRSVVYEQKLFVHIRSVWLMLKNVHGQLWIPRRSYSRTCLPGYLDGSVVGHVSSGEKYEQAMIREAMEEVGLNMHEVSYKLLGKLTPKKDRSFCFTQVYEAMIDQAPQHWNKEEFCEWFWLTPQELLQKCNDGDMHKNSLPTILKKFYFC